MVADLEPAFERLVPTSFPNQGDLLKRIPVPTFFQNEHHAVAVHSATGINNLVTTACDNLALIEETIHSFGFVLDQDSGETVAERYQSLKDSFAQQQSDIELPDTAGSVASGSPRTGLFILPDNTAIGTLESLLTPAGEFAYSQLSAEAARFIDAVDTSCLEPKDRRDFQKPFGQEKARIAAVGAVLRPGKAIQVSLQDNQWITDASINAVVGLKAFDDFLSELFELTRS